MKRVIRCSKIQNENRKVRNARGALNAMNLSDDQRNFLEEAYSDCLYRNVTDGESFDRCKHEWAAIAIEDELFDDDDFERAFNLVVMTHNLDSMPYA